MVVQADAKFGYAFALPRLIAQSRRTQCAPGGAQSLGSLWRGYSCALGISCVFVAHALLPIVRPKFACSCSLCSSCPSRSGWPFCFSITLNSLMAALLRRLGLYSAGTNIPFQHFVIMTLVTILARAGSCCATRASGCSSLGIFWLGLLGLNLLSLSGSSLGEE